MDLLIEKTSVFGGVFNEWRIKRVNKLLEVFGKDWFANKKIFELGCGFGNIGLYFKSLGADVYFSDIRNECLDQVLLKDPFAKTIQLDQNTDWYINDRFDLIIHFGISYHLNNWQRDILKCCEISKYVAYDTDVNKFINDICFPVKNMKYDHSYYGSLNGSGSLPSVITIENLFNENKITFQRHDDINLNINSQITYNTLPTLIGEKSKQDVFLDRSNHAKAFGGRKFFILQDRTKHEHDRIF